MPTERIKTAVVLCNLGTPDKPTKEAVRRYLKEFLWDSRVIEGGFFRRMLWWLVLNLIILNVRPRKVAKLYESIWDQDSPMRKILHQQVASLQLALQQAYPGNSPEVFAAMTYGSPGLERKLKELHQSGYRRILVMPLYPQFSATSTGPVFDVVSKFQLASRDICDIRILRDYHDHDLYIDALAQSVEKQWDDKGKGEKLIMSFHGVPKEYADKGDPYPQQCLQTAELLGEKLGLRSNEYQATFQSRFGPAEWVKPYTDETLESLGKSGVKRLDIMSPAFSADCLETLEEIAEENREVFEEAGGEVYHYIPALNASEPHIKLLLTLVEEQAGHWLQQTGDNNRG